MQNMKQLAYQFLLQTQMKELNPPLDAIHDLIAKQNIVLARYTESNFVKARLPAEIWSYVENGMKTNKGLSFVYNGISFIMYCDDLSVGEKKQVIFHEVGHLVAGHRLTNVYQFKKMKYTSKKQQNLHTLSWRRFAS